MSQTSMTCADCDELFLDWFEGQLDAGKRNSVNAHISSCARCQGLVRDIDGIRGSAASLPELSPSRDLWKGIEARIHPSVVSIAAPRRNTLMPPVWLAAAAAALIVVTSSVTYVATSKTINGKKPAANAMATSTPARVAGATVEPQATPPAGASALTSETADASGSTLPVGSIRATSAPAVALASRRRSPAMAATASELALAGEIGRLQTLLRLRRDQLEPATVRIVEDNLAIIDAAVSQARSALARDPASGFLNERLEGVLQKKVELLRTVALLRSST